MGNQLKASKTLSQHTVYFRTVTHFFNYNHVSMGCGQRLMEKRLSTELYGELGDEWVAACHLHVAYLAPPDIPPILVQLQSLLQRHEETLQDLQQRFEARQRPRD